jgi:U3 small nucleolar RNA-associated protein 10
LRVFTDATNHVPRHRRIASVSTFFCFIFHLTYLDRFYIHLVDVLGPEEFLTIVCMLIVAKADKRLVRLEGRDLRAALTLPLNLLHHYSSDIQLPVSTNSLPWYLI